MTRWIEGVLGRYPVPFGLETAKAGPLEGERVFRSAFPREGEERKAFEAAAAAWTAGEL